MNAIEVSATSRGFRGRPDRGSGRSGAGAEGRSSARRVSAAFALFTLLPLGVLTYAALTLSTRALEREVRAKVLASATLEGRAVATRMEGLGDLVASLARRQSVVGALGDGSPESRDLSGLQDSLEELVDLGPGFSFAAVVDPTGRAIAGSPVVPANIGQDFSSRDWYRGVARTGQPYVSEAYQPAAPDVPPSVAVAVPIRSGEPAAAATVLGYLAVGYPLDTIQEFVSAFEERQAVSLTVTDQRGTIVAAPGRRARSGLVSATDDAAVQRALAGEQGTASVEKDVATLAGFVPVAEIGWTAHADVPKAEAFEAVAGLRRTVGVIAGGLAAGLVAGSLLLGRMWRARADAEAREHDAAQYARSLIEASLDPLVTISPDGTITDANDAATQVTGAPRGELIGSDFSDYFTEPDRARAGYRQAFAEGSVAGYPLTMRHRDGRQVEVLYNASLYRDAAGKVGGVVAAARDVTDRKRAEAEIARRADELELVNANLSRSNDELEQFAYVASHDLSEPLRAISGPISLLARRYHGQLDDEADQFITFAVDGCQRMQNIIEDLLVYSRVGRLERSVEPVDCNHIVDTVLTALGPTIAETKAIIHVEPLPVVAAEATQLTQLFQNLIGNALKFVPSGAIPEVSVAAEPAGAAWRFTVTDSGIGIEAQHRQRIFAMFKRLHSRDDYPGTGIGLAVAKKIVERHGGRIGVDDSPAGTGTRFWFTLPGAEAR